MEVSSFNTVLRDKFIGPLLRGFRCKNVSINGGVIFSYCITGQIHWPLVKRFPL